MSSKASNYIFIVLFFVTFLKPFNVTLIPTLDVIFKGAKIILTGLLMVMFLLQRKKVSKVTKYCWLFLVSWGIGLLWNRNIENNIMDILSVFGLFLFFDYYRGIRYEKFIYKTLYVISALYIFLHTVTIILDHPLFASAIVSYDKYFLGGDNRSAFILIVLGCILFLYDLKYKKRIRLSSYGIALIAYFGLAYTFSVAGLIAYTALLIATVFMFDPLVNKVFNLKTCTTVIVVFVSFVIFFYNPNFVNSITGLFGKTGLSSREKIWPLAFSGFLRRPIFGYGALTEAQIGAYYLYGTNHTHNIILEFLMMTGIVGIVLFVKFFMTSIRICKKTEKKSIYRMLVIGCCTFLICSLFDFYLGLIYFYLLIGLFTFSSSVLPKKALGGEAE